MLLSKQPVVGGLPREERLVRLGVSKPTRHFSCQTGNFSFASPPSSDYGEDLIVIARICIW